MLLPVLLLVGCGAPEAHQEAASGVDLVIRNGLVLDGNGGDPVRADVVIDEGRILTIGATASVGIDADRIIDASGRTVAPGFIDPHSHGDPLETPDFENFLAMGVTTIALGQDGDSPDVPSLSAWLDEVAARGIGVNLAMFTGHGTLRNQSGIGMDPDPDAAALRNMLERLDTDLDVCFGMSTGLEYNPGLNASSDELAALAEVVGARGRLIMSHMRNEDDDQLATSLTELMQQGEFARVHVSHLKSVYGKGEARAEEILKLLADARAAGVRISADSYPYTASYTGIGLLFPVWSKTAEQFEVARETRRQELADYLRARVNARNGPEATLLGMEPFVGETLAEVSARLEMPFEDVLIDVIGPQGGYAAYFVMDDALETRLMIDPDVSVCSDGSPTGFHPRGHGAFAKVIEEYVVGRRLLSLPEAVRKMTSLPADTIGIGDRGRLAPGMAADILIFDPARVGAPADYTDPLQLAKGFDVVIVNGKVARENGELAAGLHGQVLTPPPTARALQTMAAHGDDRPSQVDRLFADYQGPGMPGAAVMVVRDGEPILIRTYGLADVDKGVPIRPETNFRLASLTKQFTAACIMMLVARGELSLDATLPEVFEGFPDYGRSITIRQLMGHTSGLIDYESLIPEGFDGQVSDRDALKSMYEVDHTYFEPGTQYRYSNTGYAMLAVLIENVSGKPFAEFLEENIFEPLSMDHTVAYQRGISSVSNRAFGYTVEDGAVTFSDQSATSAVLGDGGIYTSVLDYLKWDRALYTEALLSRDLLNQMWTAGLGEYGLGWRVDAVDGHRRLHHDGSTSGFRNYVIRYPDDHVTVLVLTNRRGPDVRPLAERVAGLYLSAGQRTTPDSMSSKISASL
jgi:CubicO group peptidase (beta-lactamase class C family)/N-acyl-D-aspartate/D-glutamate deacylase